MYKEYKDTMKEEIKNIEKEITPLINITNKL